MKKIRSPKVLILATAAFIAVTIGAGAAKAQSVQKGTFTLPFEAHWGQAVLPPGQYTFILNKGTLDGTITLRNEARYVGMVMANGFSDWQHVKNSELIAVGTSSGYRIRSLRLAEAGITYEYNLPKSKRPVIAEAPQLIRHVAVTFSGK
jgi:hypothetical protein